MSEVIGKQSFDRNTAMYSHVVVRADLSPAQQVVQAIHAGMSVTAQYGGLQEDTRLVLLSVKDQQELSELAGKLESNQIPFSMFHEPDYGVGYSALATPPDVLKNRKAFKKLKLWELMPQS